MSEKKVDYFAQPYAVEKYGIDPTLPVTFVKDIELPYYGICFARQYLTKDEPKSYFESYWKEDQDKPWEETLTFKLLSDENIKIGKRSGISVDRETGKESYAVDYFLMYYDVNHYMNKPSCLVSISDATNVISTVVVEMVFAFEDGYILPVYKTYTTGGSYALSFSDIVNELIEDLNDCSSNEDTFFFDSPNVTIDNDEIRILVCSEQSCDTELTFSNDNFGWRDIKRALSSIRIVDIKEEIQ